MRQLIKSLNIKIYDFVQTKWLRQNIQKKYLAISMIPFEKIKEHHITIVPQINFAGD